MQNEFRPRPQRNNTRMIFDITRAIIIFAVGIVMIFGDRLEIPQVTNLDPLLRYFFAGISLLYGGFRLYRGIKQEY